jgi:NADH-quinone oxidoreductase subunit E
MPALNDEIRHRILDLIPRYPRKQAVTLPALHLVHDHYRTVSNDAMIEIAELLELHPSEVHDTMTFYAFFKTGDDKLGAKRFWVCRGLACMLRGAYELIDHCEKSLGVHCGQTTPDGKITLEFAECIGACDGAPACLIDDVHEMNVTPERAEQLIKSPGVGS